MLLFFDTEFNGLYKDTSLISIGLVSEDGKEIYCEIADDKLKWTDDWIAENILANTIYYGGKDVDSIVDEENYYVGSKEEIQGVLRHWLGQFDNVQLVSDVCHYDMVLFIDLFGTAFDLPKNVSPYCHDINQDIASYYYIDDSKAFEVGREDILQDSGIVVDGEKHNSLYDAKVIKEIYGIVNNGSL